VGSYISEYLRSIERISDDERRSEKEVALMPTTLSTTVRHIYDRVPNLVHLLRCDLIEYIEGERTFKTTPKGMQVLMTYHQMEEMFVKSR
jgi:predicted transcriptional regulator